VVHTLVDNVSKNGNLLLNVVQRPDGSLDPEVEQMLEQMAAWSAIHGEAIYRSRPWRVYGEGAVKAKGGSFKEDYSYSSRDIRFTHEARPSTPSRSAGRRTTAHDPFRLPGHAERRSTASPTSSCLATTQDRVDADRRGPGGEAACDPDLRTHGGPEDHR